MPSHTMTLNGTAKSYLQVVNYSDNYLLGDSGNTDDVGENIPVVII